MKSIEEDGRRDFISYRFRLQWGFGQVLVSCFRRGNH